jgi:VWFA-related protein
MESRALRCRMPDRQDGREYWFQRRKQMRPITVFLFASITGLFCTATAGFAQAAAAGAPPGATQASHAGAVTLDVVVTDKSGTPVADLQPGDFKLLDKKQPLNIVSVREADGVSGKGDAPAEAILVMDAVNGSLETVRAEQQELARFLEENGGELALPTSLVVLSDQGMTVRPPTSDGKALVEFLNGNIPGMRPISTWGWDADQEREQLSLKALDFLIAQGSKRPGRKLMIWLSPGWRQQTGGSEGWVASEKAHQQLFNHVAMLTTAMRAARVTLYCLDPSGIDAELTFQGIYEVFLKGLDLPKRADYGYLLLQVLATQTGGKAFSAPSDMGGLLRKCIDDARAYYVLSFIPPADAQPSEFHSIEVQVDKPGLKARTRTVYYGKAAAPAKQSVSLEKPAN